MRFSKWHALGNAYLLVERADLDSPLEPDAGGGSATRIAGSERTGCSRWSRSDGPEAEIVVWNPDGSTAELSGNGARIAAVWLARRSGVAFPRLRIGDRDGPRACRGRRGRGRPRRGRGRQAGGTRDRRRAHRDHARLGRQPTRRHPARPSARSCCASARSSRPTSASRHGRTSSSSAPSSPNDLAVLVWERGVGETLASGSSAAAAAAAAVTHGWCENPVRVHLPGGTLTVDIREGGPS